MLYTTEVNDLLNANLPLLRRVYEQYQTLTRKVMSYNDAVNLFHSRSDCQISEKEVLYCFGMSKMTVPFENEDTDAAKYDKLLFVEFLEMIGRVAEYKFRGTELENLGLDKKIEEILDNIFAVLGKDAKRKTVDIDLEENTASDSDY